MSYALIAHKAAVSGNGTSVTTVGVDTTGATLLIAVVTWYAPGGSVLVSDSNGNTGWTKLTTSAGGLSNAIWYCIPTSVGAAHTFTAAGFGTTFPSIAITAFSGAASSSVFDVENGNNASATSITTGSITPGSANELIISGFASNSATAGSIDTGFTITDNLGPGLNNYAIALAYLIQTSASAVNPTWTGSGFLTVSIASFKAAGGAPPAGGLFLPAQLAGLGSGGPFFPNPLN